ncbi:malonyl-ACP O-methyltransferase BioC, partial [Parabacteroides sp. OttesenSCG-928-K15]|nr:malonyl-ACP O-methyltransferase BioC [Parabacteroides sp. OttesenSCG-928-K15]
MTQQQIIGRFSRALPTYDEHATVQQAICHRLTDLLRDYPVKHFSRVLEIGCGSGYFTRLLYQHIQADEWVVNDLCSDCESGIRSILQNRKVEFVAGDASRVAFCGPFDLIASASAMQWIEDLPGFIRRVASLLAPGGLFLGNVFAPGNLHEIRTLTGQGLSYPSVAEWKEWLAPHFHILHLEEEERSLTFRHPADVLKHLKYTGVTATNSTPWTRGRLMEFSEKYKQQFSSAAGVALTYKPL